MSLPPVQLNPSSTILGNDGNWVTYTIQVGTPPKTFNVLPSTVLADTWTINPQVCSALSGNNQLNCAAQRGSLFDPSMSSTWQYLFNDSSLVFSLGIEGGYGWNQSQGGAFGSDNLILVSEKGSVPVSGSVISSMKTNATATGLLGLASKQVSVSDPSGQTSVTNSTLQLLRDAGEIPSMSFSYSAGAFYNSSSGLLILGGYDAASYVPNNVPFTFAPDVNNYLSVGLISVTATVDGNTTQISDSQEQALIDSTVAELWLPETWCDAFANVFNLTFNQNNQLYTISKEAIAANQKKNPTVTIEIANTQNANGNTVSINFPWAAFQSNYTNLQDPAYSNVPYFMLRRTSGPYTLGRSFLQEAVLTVDHERKNFSVAQVVDLSTTKPQLVSISSLSATSSSGGNGGGSSTASPEASSGGGGISGGAIGGIVVAVVVLAAAAIAGFFLWRRRRNNKYSSPEQAKADTPGPQRLPPAAFNEKSGPSEMPSPDPGNGNNPMNDYHAQQRQNVKAVMAMSGGDHSELDGDMSHGERAQSPLPAYSSNGAPMHGISSAAMMHQPSQAAELPAANASELHSEHASPMSSPHFSPNVSELAPSPGEDGPLAVASDMGWGGGSPGEPQSPHSAESLSLSPVRGGVHMRDIRNANGRTGPSSPGVGNSNRGSEVLDMRATSGPLPLGPLPSGLGIQDRETSDNLRRQDSTRSRNSESTLVSGSHLPTSSVSSALHPAPLNARRRD